MIPDNARTLRITAAAGTELAGASSPGTVSLPKRRCSSRATGVYTPKCVIPHAASLRQPFGHCARFPTAASRRSLGRLSVPMWLAILSDQLLVVALVGRYPHQLADKPRAPRRAPWLAPQLSSPQDSPERTYAVLPGRWAGYPPRIRQVAHVLRTRSPVALAGPLDLHVLSTPPAFVLSQDQTLHEFYFNRALIDSPNTGNS